MRRSLLLIILSAATVLTAAVGLLAQQQPVRVIPEDNRPPLFFRESWKNPEVQERKVVQSDLTNSNLELKLHGPAAQLDVRIVIHTSPKDDPSYIWSGSSPVNWGLTLRDKDNYVDLSSPVAKIRWRTKQAAFNLLRPVLRLADGSYLVGDYTEGYTGDWRETEFSLSNVRWRSFDPVTAVTTRTQPNWVVNPDLSRVDEVGFTDLTRGSGGGAGGGSRIDWIEVYGFPVKRDAQTSAK